MNRTEVKLTAKQKRVYDFVCQYHAEHDRVPKHREIADRMGYKSDGHSSAMIQSLVKKGVLCRREGQQGFRMPDEPTDLTVKVAPTLPPRKQSRKPKPPKAEPETIPAGDEFQYVRLAPGQAAEIGDVYIGVVDIESDKGVAAIEVIAPAAMGVLRRDVPGEDEQPRGISQAELLLRCLEKARDLINIEIEVARQAANGSHFINH